MTMRDGSCRLGPTMSERINSDEKSIHRLKLMSHLYEFAYRIKKQALRNRHPEKDDRELHLLTLALIEKGCS